MAGRPSYDALIQRCSDWREALNFIELSRATYRSFWAKVAWIIEGFQRHL